MKKGMFMGAGTTNSAVAVIRPKSGVIACDSLSYTDDDAGLLKFYLPKFLTTANAAVAASTTLVVVTDASGYIADNAVLTTNDYALVEDSSGTGWQLRSIAAVGAVSSSTVSLTLGATITCASGDTIYIVRAADIHSITTAAETRVNLLNLFFGYENMPVAIELTSGSTGSHFVSGSYHVEDY